MRLKESLDALDAALAKQEESLRRAQDARLPAGKRIAMVEAAVADLKRLGKESDEVVAQARAAAKSGPVDLAVAEQTKAVGERLQRLGEGWKTVFESAAAELRKSDKSDPPKQ